MAPRTTATPETVERPAALKGTELGVAVVQAPVEAGPVAVVGVTRRREEDLAPAEVAAAQAEVAAQTVLVRVTVTVIAEEALAEEERPAETPEGRGLPEEIGDIGETPTAGDEGALVTAGAVQGAVVAAAEVGMEDPVTEGTGVAEEEVDPSWQSASPRTARQRLMGMLIRPPLESELCLQWTSPRTARQTLIGTLIKDSLSLLEELAWSHFAWPRAATQALTGTLMRPLVVLCCLHSASPRMPAQRPTGKLIKLSVAWTPYARHRLLASYPIAIRNGGSSTYRARGGKGHKGSDNRLLHIVGINVEIIS